MGIADFNKDNPFVITMRKLDDELYTKSLHMTKFVFMTIIYIILISVIEIFINIKICYIPITLSLFSIYYNITTWRELIIQSELTTVNKIIYGDEFSAINVNNERVFEIIAIMNQAKGQLSFFIKKLYYDIIFFTFVFMIIIIIKIIFK